MTTLYVPKVPHPCRPPKNRAGLIIDGTVWECNDCGRRWIAVGDRLPWERVCAPPWERDWKPMRWYHWRLRREVREVRR